MKTNGQRLYEHKNPSHIRVIRVEDRAFTQPGDVFTVPNPASPVPWKFLTEKCKQSWESTARGHYLFSSEPTHG